MADSLPDSRGGGEAGTAGVVGAKTDGLPVLPCGEGTQEQQKEEAALNQSAVAARSSDQQNVFGSISVHPAGVGSVLPAGMEKEDTDMQQNECGVSIYPARVGSVVPPGKESVDTESLVVVQNDSESTKGDSSKTQGGLIQGSHESVLALVNMAPGGKGSEDTGNQVVVHNSSENASSESSKTQSEPKLIQGSDESKLEKVSVSQAKDPPDRDSSYVTQEAAVTGVGEPPTTVAAVSVSTKLPESLLTPPDNTSNLPGPEQPASGPPALEQPASGLPAPPEAALSTEDMSEGSAVPAVCGGTLSGHCQSAVVNSSQPQSIPTEQSPSLGLDSLRSASSGGLLEASTTAQASPKASVPLSTPEAAGAEGISSQSSHLSSMPLGSDSSPAGGVGVLSSSAPQETGGTVAVSLSQSEGGGESESQVPVSEGPCLEECLSTESKRQTDITGGNACVMTDGEKNRTERKATDMLENVTGQSDIPVEPVNNWNDRNFTCEAGTETETLPLIVATHSLSHEQNAEKEPDEAVESAAAAEVNVSRKKVVPLLDSEPLRPVTIGSSLQPLEEVQEATAAEEASSFTTDLAIMDSSADEADSIGGLVINNVIGAADGVVDFQPDEVEAEKELMDISSSAPQLSDTTEEHGPSAKRRRLENGPGGGEDKTDGAKKVILKVIPVKNGHGVWDSQKLQEVLLAKGTILLQIHASREGLELCEADKTDTEKKVDFTAIMAVAKDDDHDSSLSCGSGGGDPEVDDPLAIGSSTSETTTHPSYGRSFPPSRGRSTALQPAMPPRPTFKHLQTPQHYYLKNEVLGLPPPLEFEEPQGGSADMSGMDTHTVAFPGPQVSAHSCLPLTPRVASEKSRIAKVCAECGKVFLNPLSYTMHARTHQPWLECDKCPFRTKLNQKLQWHQVVHKRNPDHKCFTCHKLFARVDNLLVHQKKMHGIYQCKYCGSFWMDNEGLRSHLQEVYNNDGRLPSCWVEKNPEGIIPTVPQIRETDESQLTGSFCQAVDRVTEESKVHMAQHVEVPDKDMTSEPLSDIPEVFVKQEKESNEDSNSSSASCDLPSTFPDAMETKQSPQQPVEVVNRLSAAVPTFSSDSPFRSGSTLLSHNPMSQSFSMIRPHSVLPPHHLITANEEGDLDTHTLPPEYIPGAQALASSSGLATFNPDATSVHVTLVPDDTPVPDDAQVPDVTPSTSSKSVSQTGAAGFTLIQGRDEERKRLDTLFRCKLCPCAFLTPSDFQTHCLRTHSDILIPKFPISRMNPMQIIQQPKVNDRLKSRGAKPKQKLPCDICQEVFSTKALAKHKKRKHRKAYKCSDCNLVLKAKHKLMRHQRAVHKDKFRCRYGCGKLFNTYEEWVSHSKKVHKKDCTKHECSYCQKPFIYEASLLNHLEKCQKCPSDKKPAHVCGNCEGFFPNIEAYNEHAASCLPTLKERVKKEALNTSPRGKKRKVAEKDGAVTSEENSAGKPENTDQAESSDSAESDDFDMGAAEAGSDGDFPGSDTPTSSTGRQRPPSDGLQRCRYCPDVYLRNENVISHILLCHADLAKPMMVAPKKCEMCGHIFKNTTCLCKHLMKHYSKLNKWDAFVPRDILTIVKVKGYCWICNTHQDFQTSTHGLLRDTSIDEALEIEEIVSTQVEPLKCDMCNELFPTRKMFWHHVKEHLAKLPAGKVHYVDSEGDDRLFECCKCHFKCSDRDGLYQHITSHFMVKDEEITQVNEEADAEPEDSKVGDTEASGKSDAEASREKDLEGNVKDDMEASRKSDTESSGEDDDVEAKVMMWKTV